MKKFKKLISFILALLIALPTIITVNGNEIYTTENLTQIYEDVINREKQDMGLGAESDLLSGEYLDYAGSTAGDWYPIALSRLCVDDDYSAYLSALKSYVEKSYKTSDLLSRYKATEWHRISLCLLACGGNPESFGTDKNGNPINLIADGVYNRGKTSSLGKQGINGWIWGLIALDVDSFSVPTNAETSKEEIINEILKAQQNDGGWSLSGNTSDVDLTAMALQALSVHRNDTKVKQATEKAVDFLSKEQNSSGGFESWGTENAESCAQVIIALTSLGISPNTDKKFIKNGNTVLDALLSFKCKDGGFTHSFENDTNNPTATAGEYNSMASVQALLAIASLIRFNNGSTSLYDFSDTSVVNSKFTSKDKKSADSLPDDLTTKNYGEVCTLLYKAENSQNEQYIKILSKKKEQIEKIQNNIDKINSEIYLLYPIENVSLSDSGTVEEIMSLYSALSDYDKTKINGYDDVKTASAKIKEEKRNIIVFVALALVLAFIIIFVAVRIKKRKRKKQLEFIIEDD
jgi:hypothetical protein